MFKEYYVAYVTFCKQAFGFTRNRYNCYNYELVHRHACSSKKALQVALVPTLGKPHFTFILNFPVFKCSIWFCKHANKNKHVSSTPSCSSHASGHDDIESLGDVFIWGEVWSDMTSSDGSVNSLSSKSDVTIPKLLESNVVIDVQQIACGVRHFSLVTKQGEVFTWGKESGGRLGHGIEKDFGRPRLVEFLAVTNVDFVACGEFHTCAISTAGDLYTWGDGSHNAGILGHGTDASHWIPKRVSGPLEGLVVISVACSTWHTALATVDGKLFTFGDGKFGVLGHGDRESVKYPKEVQSLIGLKTSKVACGVWHTAAIVEITNHHGGHSTSRKLFTWGDGDKYRLGHGNKDTYLQPTCISALIDYNFHQLACGHSITLALTTSGHVFSMGSPAYGQLGNPQSDGKLPCLVQDGLVGEFVEEIACGAYHVAVLTSRSEIFTWGMGARGRLGHGDTEDRKTPTLVESLKDRHVKSISCGASYTASICIHKWVSGADQSVCSGCKQAFGFTRKRHNCYNCGLVHCHACSSRKALKAALAPTPGKPHRICDSCYTKLKKSAEVGNNNASTYHRRDIAFPCSLGALQNSPRHVATTSSLPFQPQFLPPPQPPSQPQPQAANSRPASPYSRRPSPPCFGSPMFSRGVIDGLNKSNDLLNQEVSKLHNQVKALKKKTDRQDLEIRKLRTHAEESASLASKETTKCLVAVDVFKGVRSQLKELTEKLPPEISDDQTFQALNSKVDDFLHTHGTVHRTQSRSHLQSDVPNEISISSEAANRKYHKIENSEDVEGTEDRSQNADVAPLENNGSYVGKNSESASQTSTDGGSRLPKYPSGDEKKEVIEQFEPGVYVTVIQLSNGTKIFKRVRFSKRRFVAQQAEEWWKENKGRVFKKYSPAKPRSGPSTSAAQTTPNEEP
ncbi:Brevis radix-like domain-containing protein [Cynara cardunculus var. scolymus]|uniref:Brevis radix-like domain-containing protein n=1 Tax=Cynara cardunculus var. scolymus TaxID=59895 RepID=A0A103XC19_CYNCS|nr:Brevis radix-like domain-containing protein [Cynara cardunculus var. scolymus]